jgi:hypothetical protein
MKKYILTTIVALGLSFSALADVATVTVIPATYTNLFTGYGRITSMLITATTGTNVTATMYDTPTNSFSYVVPAYTNTISYLTNYPAVYTNYFGVTTTLTNSTGGTNYVLVDVPNTVAQTTNNYVSYGLAAPASTTVTVPSPGINMMRGAWITNTSASGIMSVTVVFTRQ